MKKYKEIFLFLVLSFLSFQVARGIEESKGDDTNAAPVSSGPGGFYSRLVIQAANTQPEIIFELHEIVKIAQQVMGMVEVGVTSPTRKPNYKTYEEQIEGEFERLKKTWYRAAERHFSIPAGSLKWFLDAFYQYGPNPLLMSSSHFSQYQTIMSTIRRGASTCFIAPDYDPHILPEYIEPTFTAPGWLWVARYLATTLEPISGWWIRLGGRLVRIKNCREDKKHLYVSDHGVDEEILHDTKKDFLVFSPRSHDASYSLQFCNWFFGRYNVFTEGLSRDEQELFKRRIFLLLHEGRGGSYCKNELLFYVLSLPPTYRKRVLDEGRLDIPFYNVGTSIGMKEKPSDDRVTPPLSEKEETIFSSMSQEDLEEYDLTFRFTIERLRFRGHVQVPVFFGGLFGRSGGRVGLSPFFTQIDQIFHPKDGEAFKTFYTLKELKKLTSRGLQEDMFRPLHSFGEADEGPSYNDFSKALKCYRVRAKNPIPDTIIASYMRHVLKGGRVADPELYFIPNLCAAWFTGEIARNDVSLLTSLVLLDFMETGQRYLDSEGNNLYSLRHLLVHPKKPFNSMDKVPITDIYGNTIDLAVWDGMHPMAHRDSKPDSKTKLDNPPKDGKGKQFQLKTVRQKEGHLLIHWLSKVLSKKGISAHPDKGILTLPHNYDDVEKLFSPSNKTLKNIKGDASKLRKASVLQEIKQLFIKRANSLENFLNSEPPVVEDFGAHAGPGTGDLSASFEEIDDDIALTKRASLKEAEKEGRVGPRTIEGWVIDDVEDRGNCFYDAVVHQMQLSGHSFLTGVPAGTKPRNSLRLRVQGETFKDEEWADDPTIDTFLRKFPNCILAVIDTNHPEAGFTCYFCNDPDIGEVLTYAPGAAGVLPVGRTILRIAATGNHFMSITSHPALTNGLLRDAWSST